jgi:hypothetical protein
VVAAVVILALLAQVALVHHPALTDLDLELEILLQVTPVAVAAAQEVASQVQVLAVVVS